MPWIVANGRPVYIAQALRPAERPDSAPLTPVQMFFRQALGNRRDPNTAWKWLGMTNRQSANRLHWWMLNQWASAVLRHPQFNPYRGTWAEALFVQMARDWAIMSGQAMQAMDRAISMYPNATTGWRDTSGVVQR